MRIQIIDMCHPPGIGMLPIDDMPMHSAIAAAVQAATASAEAARKHNRDVRPDINGHLAQRLP
ncbi:hypothetical protein [Dyella acidiphila]|uniref:hypothetical protein n=1 Tax=Dyella acidiphila TaxID=2775866 RepID=UPI001CE4AE47|nr:hypothetical protein [Dyella acidiphila]